jgi:hydroxyacylglutathione hydrolase
MQIDIFTGGAFETNNYFIPTQEGGILVDAAEGVCDWLRSTGRKVSTLLITHAHFDHVTDAALVRSSFGCRVGCHRDGKPMLSDREFFIRLGFPYEVEPVEIDFEIAETPSLAVDGVEFAVYDVPGHCPGSLCYFLKSERILFCGDVLFAGSIGRSDFPGGDGQLLMDGITGKLLSLGDDVRVAPGHGPGTTLGRERASNPFLTRI